MAENLCNKRSKYTTFPLSFFDVLPETSKCFRVQMHEQRQHGPLTKSCTHNEVWGCTEILPIKITFRLLFKQLEEIFVSQYNLCVDFMCIISIYP